MGFRKRSLNSKALSVSILLVGLAASLPLARAVRADSSGTDSCLEQSNSDKKDVREDETNYRRVISEDTKLLTDLESDDKIGNAQHPEWDNDCNCLPTQGSCPADFWTKIVKAEDFGSIANDGTNGCMTIYKKFSSALQSNLPPTCFTAVSGTPGDHGNTGCGLVHRLVLKAKTARELAADQDKLRNEIPQRKKDITEALKECRKDCPNCGAQSAMAMMKPREPGVGDYLIAGLQGITPMVLGGMNMYMYNQGLKNYTQNYGSYLGQCTTVGVPCGAPMMMRWRYGRHGYDGHGRHGHDGHGHAYDGRHGHGRRHHHGWRHGMGGMPYDDGWRHAYDDGRRHANDDGRRHAMMMGGMAWAAAS